jgi:ankyrin repeat protein
MRTAIILLLLAAQAAAQTVEGLFVRVAPGVVVDLSDLDARDDRMATPLHRVVAVTEDIDLVRMMLARGADARARDAEGSTPLHAAATAGAQPGILAALLDGGADVSARDVRGRTALHLAATAAAAAALIHAGADACALDAEGRAALAPDMLEEIRRRAPEAYPAARDAFLECL